MSRGTCTVVIAELIFASRFSRWGSLPWHAIDDRASRLCPLNLCQEAWEVVAAQLRHSGSPGTWRGGHLGSSAGRSTTGTSSRLQTGKQLAASESHWSRLSVDTLREPDRAPNAEINKEESSQKSHFQIFVSGTCRVQPARRFGFFFRQATSTQL